ncbi:MAG TPA: hypothetical protein VFX59_04610 [Polyangiales bacterium]|nr:hypothetical protein [Polyangiales bacterium]
MGILVLCLLVAGALFAYRQHRRRERNKPPPTQRELVQAAIQARPGDPWPRGEGHVLLAEPGSREWDKGYHEPGGSFSPSAGTFGIAIWVSDAQGKLLATSDSIPLDKIEQRFEAVHSSTPALVTETPYYRARWHCEEVGDYTLALEPLGDAQLSIVVRSVGPAGGPVRHLAWAKDALTVSHRWSVAFGEGAQRVKLGEEGPDWTAAGTGKADATATSQTGWAFARVDVQGKLALTVHDLRPTAPGGLTVTYPPEDHLQLPDARFVDSLYAQEQHLLMSLVGDEARPGEPINYPLPWLRDGAFTAVALTRAGQLSIGRRMARYYANHDFFGGFGSEGDAMGFGLWVIDEVTQRAHDPELDRELWPHVYRKAEFIKTLMEATETIRVRPVQGPIVPNLRDDPWMSKDIDLVADKARDGLIIGRMDGHRPILYINAVNYMGLRRAARIAERMGEPGTAQRWRDRASKLRTAWRRGFDTEERNNDRTSISTLWPSFIGLDVKPEFTKLLDERWKAQRDDKGAYKTVREWTYFDAAEMHQYVMLGQPDKTWTTLDYYFAHQQSSPGLYTWSEGTGEENTFGLWNQVRGWLKPKHVTPHYWTASEMLLLQLDMLAYVEESESAPTYVIGAGVQKSWLDEPMHVSGIGTSRGTVDWSWDNGKLSATIHGEQAPVRAGPAFDDVKVEAQFAP